jgi:enoyl-CoA hydratase/carnithine racemase
VEWHVVRYAVVDHVATVTLDRPGRGNAWTGRMEVEYRRALALADDDPDVRVVVLTGAGHQFCVGADSRALEGHAERGGYDDGVREPLPRPGDPSHPAHGTRHGFLLSMSVPVIAAVNGAAAGIGFVLMCFADVRFVAADAKLTTSTAKLGLPAEYGLSWILPRLVGAGRAAHLLYASPVIRGSEAPAMGLALQAVEDGRTLEVATAYAHTLATALAPTSLRTMKRQLWTDLSGSLADADENATALVHRMMGSDDYAEGVAALTERRVPRF